MGGEEVNRYGWEVSLDPHEGAPNGIYLEVVTSFFEKEEGKAVWSYYKRTAGKEG